MREGDLGDAPSVWSGAQPLPPAGGWYDGRCFWLNNVFGEELYEDDPRLTEEQRRHFDEVEEGQRHSAVFELPAGDPLSYVGLAANNAALSLEDLNHDPRGLRAALLTTFDLVDDVAWLCRELRLPESLSLTICSHPWPDLGEERQRMLEDVADLFEDAVVHFPGHGLAVDGGTDRATVPETSSGDEGCSVHAKLMLLEFADRLRVVVSTANLMRRHWQLLGEAVWVQDFPPVAGTAPDASRLLVAGPFARRLAHFTADLLAGAPRDRRGFWTERLSGFDLSGAAADLVLSLPSAFCRARAVPSSAMALRLPVASAAPWVQSGVAALRPAVDGGWELHRRAAGSEEAALGSLRGEQAAALHAAAALGLRLRPEVELLPCGWDDSTGTTDATVHGRATQEQSPPELVARAVVEGDCSGRWTDADDVAALLRHLEVNYGLFALEEHLAGEDWRQPEERHYAAITGSLGWLDDRWRANFDRLTGRVQSEGPAGPAVVVPTAGKPLHSGHLYLHQAGLLCEHATPWHSPGRQNVRNHSKLIVRQLWDEARRLPYGWVYMGSHNLSASAWGTAGEHGSEGPERLWVGNRELGLLFVQRRLAGRSRGDVEAPPPNRFAVLPLPFGVPVEPADIEGRYVESEPGESSCAEPEQQEDVGGLGEAHQEWWQSSWRGCGSDSWWEGSDADWEWRDGRWSWCGKDRADSLTSSEDGRVPQQADWRFRPSSTWWWMSQ